MPLRRLAFSRRRQVRANLDSVAAMRARRARLQELQARENTRPHVDLDVTVEPTREAA